MKKLLLFLLFALRLATGNGQPASPKQVEIVFCLDLSASTNGLIERMRDHLWDYTRLFMECKPAPVFRIGVVGFSRPSFKKETGYVKVLQDLTTDVEFLGKELFDLRTSIEKGDQYVGPALTACAQNISWTKDISAVKLVILAGNGQVQAGGLDPRDAVASLQAMGITVHALYCMPRYFNRKEASGWEELAALGKGKFANFSVSSRYYTAMGDFNLDRLRSLNDSLNATYLYYGPSGRSRFEILQELDQKIYRANPEGFLFRSQFKCSALFQKKNASWDLVDLLQVRGEPAFSNLDPELLPETLKRESPAEWKKRAAQARLERLRLLHVIGDMLRKHFDKTKEGEALEKKMPTFDVITCQILTEILEKNGYVCRP